ncbi:hypothetical protein [Riemerella anatipestifer]|nr:hypothetical protein [Riemerella anatipestifer]MDR7795380.1 hypothetical protein [Riemerella anatipestifer]
MKLLSTIIILIFVLGICMFYIFPIVSLIKGGPLGDSLLIIIILIGLYIITKALRKR